MNNKKKSIVLIITIVVVFVLATVAYNFLKVDAPTTSFVPNIKNENAEKIIESENTDSQLNIKDENSDSIVANEVNNQTNTSSTTNDDESSIVNNSNEINNSKESESSDVNSSIMPNIPVKMIDGTESTFWEVVPKGKPVVINLFASWCPPCKSEMPEFVETREEYKDKVTFIFFDSFDGTRETETTLNKFVDSYFTDKDTLIVLDPGYLSYIFSTNSIPVTILLNEKGEVVNGFTGSISKTTLTNAIDELLK